MIYDDNSAASHHTPIMMIGAINSSLEHKERYDINCNR